MDDGLARDGVLTRCNQDRDATLNDVECSNARRAAAAIALEAERARAGQLEQASEATLLALRDREARAAVAEREEAAAEEAAAEAAYEARWRPKLEIEAAPPSNDLVIASPQIEMTELAVVPRPFRNAATE